MGGPSYEKTIKALLELLLSVLVLGKSIGYNEWEACCSFDVDLIRNCQIANSSKENEPENLPSHYPRRS